jgi:hypothetical protein
MSLYAIAEFAIVILVLCLVWAALVPQFGEPAGRIGWIIIGAFAALWLLKLLFLAGGPLVLR